MVESAPLVVLPRELGQVPPPVAAIGHKARNLAQLLVLKARVPRFGVVTAAAFRAHVGQPEIANEISAAYAAGFADDATRIAHGEALMRVVLRTPLPAAVRAALGELSQSFAADDLLAVRASVLGDVLEATALAGALDAQLGVLGRDDLEAAVTRIYALAFHPRTMQLRLDAGLAPIGCELAAVVQRMVHSESSGVCFTADPSPALGAARGGAAQSLVRSTWGLLGGVARRAQAHVVVDVARVAREIAAQDGIPERADVQADVAVKPDALRIDDDKRRGTKMVAVADHLRGEPSLTPVQCRMVVAEAVRLEAALGTPLRVTFAFAGRLLHVLGCEALHVPAARIESKRVRTWDDRLLPTGLQGAVSPLTFSLWQRSIARGIERAGRILGVKGVILEDTRPQMPRVVGLVSGRIYGNVEVTTALLDLLPFADKTRAALARAIGQDLLIPRKAPPPGFWQRQRQRLDEGRFIAQLERVGAVAMQESDALLADVEGVLRSDADGSPHEDPDALIDRYDLLEDALSRAIAALALDGLAAVLFDADLRAAFVEANLLDATELIDDLCGGDPPTALFEFSRAVHRLSAIARAQPTVRRALEERAQNLDLLAQQWGCGAGGAAKTLDTPIAAQDEAQARFAGEVNAALALPCAAAVGELLLEAPRLHEEPGRLLMLVWQLLDSDAEPHVIDERLRAATGMRKKAEYALEQAFAQLSALRSGAQKKRVLGALQGLRQHGTRAAQHWLPLERIVAGLRRTALALGERLFEHRLIERSGDVFFLDASDIRGFIRGTSIDTDGRPLVAARKRQMASHRGSTLDALETIGVVATRTAPGEARPPQTSSVVGRAVSGGRVEGTAFMLDRLNNASLPRAAVVFARAPTLLDLPLLTAARAVVCARGSPFSVGAYALRAAGVPALVDVGAAYEHLAPGTAVVVDVQKRLVGESAALADAERRSVAPVDARAFAAEAILSNPRQEPLAARPADGAQRLVQPPIILPEEGTVDDRSDRLRLPPPPRAPPAPAGHDSAAGFSADAIVSDPFARIRPAPRRGVPDDDELTVTRTSPRQAEPAARASSDSEDVTHPRGPAASTSFEEIHSGFFTVAPADGVSVAAASHPSAEALSAEAAEVVAPVDDDAIEHAIDAAAIDGDATAVSVVPVDARAVSADAPSFPMPVPPMSNPGDETFIAEDDIVEESEDRVDGADAAPKDAGDR